MFKSKSRIKFISITVGLAIAAAFAFWAAWYYFSPVPAVRGRLAAAIGLVVGLLFAASATTVPEEV